MRMGIKEKYEALQKRYELPSYDALNQFFDLDTVEHDVHPLREVRRKIVEKLQDIAKLLEDTLHPESTLTGIHEARAFTEHEKEAIYTVYGRVMVLERKGWLPYLDSTDESEALFITEVMKEWDELKPQLLSILKKLSASWNDDQEFKEDLRYLG